MARLFIHVPVFFIEMRVKIIIGPGALSAAVQRCTCTGSINVNCCRFGLRLTTARRHAIRSVGAHGVWRNLELATPLLNLRARSRPMRGIIINSMCECAHARACSFMP